MQGDVFGLNRLYELQVLNSLGTETIQSSKINYGYFGGGQVPAIVNTFSRLDLNTEVASSLPTTLPTATASLTALSSSSYGYYAGGGTGVPANVCTISRLDFSNDSISSPGSYQLTQARQNLASVSSTNYGYFGGGFAVTPPGVTNTVDRIDFSTETINAQASDLTQARSRLVAVPSTNYGYFNGGEITGPARSCTIDRIDFTTETTSTAVNYSRVLRRDYGATFSSSYGYFAGGESPAPALINTMDRLDFSTEVTSSPGKNLVESKSFLGGVSGNLYGYFVGGTTSPVASTSSSSIERLEFSTETVTNLSGAKLPQGRHLFGSVTGSRSLNLTRNYFSESADYGYFAGGSVGGSIPVDNRSIIDRIDYSNETISAPGSVLSFSTRGANGVSSDINAYFFLQSSDINRLNYSTNLVTTISSKFFGGGYWGATSQTNSYGYVTGNTANLSRVDRLDFSTEVYSSPGKKLFNGRRSHFGDVYNSSYGYFGGGTDQPGGGPSFCTIERLDFSTEVIGLTNQFITRSTSSALSSNFYGYIANSSPPAFTDRLDFSTETIQSKLTLISTRGAGTSTNSFGYFAGGLPPSGASPFSSNIVRLNFSDETTSTLTSKLSQGRTTLAAVSGGQSQRVLAGRTTGTYGYFGGGTDATPTSVCTIERLDFSTETITVPSSSLTKTRSSIQSTASTNSYGYFGGGNDIPSVYINYIDRLDFSTETTSAPGKNLTQGRQNLAVTSSNSYGYFAGGGNPTNVCTIDRLDFSNETVLSPSLSAKLSSSREQFAAISSNSYGYFGGGINVTVPFTYISIIDRLDFSSETISTPGKNLPLSVVALVATSSNSYGYFAGGVNPSLTPPSLSKIDRIDLSTETISTPGKNLTVVRYQSSAVSSTSYGYFGGGETTTTRSCTIDRIDFFTETTSAPGKNLTQGRNSLAAVSTEQRASTVNKGFSSFTATYGYFGGGYFPGGTYVCTIDRLDFSTETLLAPGNNLTKGRNNLAAVSSSSYGYFGGGYNAPLSGSLNTIDRLDLSTEIVTIPGKNLSNNISSVSGISSKYYGYIGGSVFNPNTINRLDFSNESTSISTGKLVFGRSFYGTVSNDNYGYFCGGYVNNPPGSPPQVYTSTIERLDFSTDNLSLTGTSLSFATTWVRGVSSRSYGYFGGAYGPASPSYFKSTIQRLDFSSEILLVLDKTLPTGKSRMQSCESGLYGYFIGGRIQSAFDTSCIIDRLDFSTETLSSKTFLNGRQGGAAVSSAYKPPIRNGWGWRKTYGYFASGIPSVNPTICTIDRLDFSTETVSLLNNKLSTTNYRASAVSNPNYGYFGGGQTPGTPTEPTLSVVYRLDFSTEVVSSPGKNMSKSRSQSASVSSPLYGYFGGGYDPSLGVSTPLIRTCNIDRLDFSTESSTSLGNLLSISRNNLGACFNVSYGWFAGGASPDPLSSPALVRCTIDRLDFSNSTISVPGKELSAANFGFGFVSSASYGYFAGGEAPALSPSRTNRIERLDFSSETTSLPGKNLRRNAFSYGSVSSSSYGYISGGAPIPPPPVYNSDIERIDFSTETVNTISSTLTSERTFHTGIQAN